MFHGKMKAVTFSYDDGTTQDRRLIKLLDKYGLKCTFNLNSGLFHTARIKTYGGISVPHVCFREEEICRIYGNHEIAAHTMTHPSLKNLPDVEVIREVEEDRLRLSDLAGYEVVGMAYPGGSSQIDERVIHLVREHTGIRYARNTTSSFSFAPQTELLNFSPTVFDYREPEQMFRLAEEFIAMEAKTPQIFYIWGHAYEMDFDDTWDRMEEFFRLISGHSDIFYGTNKQVLLGME